MAYRREKVEAVRNFIFLGPKPLWTVTDKVMTNVDSILKSRNITLPTKAWIVKAIVYPVVMCTRESWIIKKAECRRTGAFELWCWRRLLRVPLTARRSNQSILKEFNPEYSLEGLKLKLKLQYFGHLMWRADSKEKTLMLGKIEGKKRMGPQRIRWLDSITDSTGMNLSKLWEIVKDREAWCTTVHGVTMSWTGLNGWTTTFPRKINIENIMFKSSFNNIFKLIIVTKDKILWQEWKLELIVLYRLLFKKNMRSNRMWISS